MKLDDFISESLKEVQQFREAYMAKHIENPDHYPLQMAEGNDGIWLEFLLQFMTEGTV